MDCIFVSANKQYTFTIKYRTSMQRNKISFKEQKIFIGIDVHAKNWEVAIAPEVGIVRRHSQKPSAKELFDFLKKKMRMS